MVIKIKNPGKILSNQLIEARISELTNMPKVSMRRMIPAKRAFRMLRLKDPSDLPRLAAESPHVHVIEQDGEYYLHPHSGIRYLRAKMGALIKQELKKSIKLEEIAATEITAENLSPS